jgi:hypothetical protein
MPAPLHWGTGGVRSECSEHLELPPGIDQRWRGVYVGKAGEGASQRNVCQRPGAARIVVTLRATRSVLVGGVYGQ